MIRRSRVAIVPRLELLDERLLLSALTPAQIDSAYGFNAISFSNGTIKGNGAGQTIAIIDAYNDPYIYGDLAAFDARNGLPTPSLTPSLPAPGSSSSSHPVFTMVNFAGAATDKLWNSEEALDVEMAHAVAPAANIVLVEAKTPALYDFLTAITAVKTLPSVSVISMSWGNPEFYGEQSFDSIFTTPAGHTGITFLASSGDNGAGDQWPASSPNVIGVGGTSLVVTSTGARASETAWADSGGGTSQFEPKPSYQAQAVSGGSRSTPDVSIVADPGTGVVINTRGELEGVGGTSLSSPLWAGMIAIADQGLVAAGKSNLYGPAQVLPDLYRAPAGSFFDIKAGTRATPGFDTSTGLGSPNAATLIGYLDGAIGSNQVIVGVGTTTGGVGTKTTAGVTTASTSANLSYLAPVPTSPTLGFSRGNPSGPGTTPATPLSLVPNVVPVPPSTFPIDPASTDAALESWDLGRSVVSSLLTGRLKPRG